MGTAGYMAPEQVRGKAVDHRADIFAFGAILYEMLSGRARLQRRTSADTMSAILNEEPPDLSETARNVPSALERIVRHCLEKNPAERFHSTGDLAFELDALTQITSSRSRGCRWRLNESRAHGSAAANWLGCVAADRGSRTSSLPRLVARPRKPALAGRIPADHLPHRIHGQRSIHPGRQHRLQRPWDDGNNQLYLAHRSTPVPANLASRTRSCLRFPRVVNSPSASTPSAMSGYARVGTLARVALSGGTPREVLENVQDADFAGDGQNIAVIPLRPGKPSLATRVSRREGAGGQHQLDQQSQDFTRRKVGRVRKPQNSVGDDEGSVSVIDPDAKENELTSGWLSLEGVAWSPAGDEIWFSASNTRSSENLRGVTLNGKLRNIANVPGGMWLQDVRNGVVLVVKDPRAAEHPRSSPPAPRRARAGLVGWSYPRNYSRDGKKDPLRRGSRGWRPQLHGIPPRHRRFTSFPH